MPCPLCHKTINGRKLGFSLKKKTFRTIFPERIPPGIVSSKSAEIGWKALGNLISTRTDLCNQSFNERHTIWKEFFLILILSMCYIIRDSEEYIRYEEGFYIIQLWRIKHFKISINKKSKVLRNWCLPKYEIPIARFHWKGTLFHQSYSERILYFTRKCSQRSVMNEIFQSLHFWHP